MNTHTEAYDEPTRNAQRDELVAVVGEPGFPVVVAGDFNAVPERIGMPAPYVDAWVVGHGEGLGMTSGQAAELGNDDSALGVRIDYLWVRDASVEACWVVGDRPEDRTTHRGPGHDCGRRTTRASSRTSCSDAATPDVARWQDRHRRAARAA